MIVRQWTWVGSVPQIRTPIHFTPSSRATITAPAAIPRRIWRVWLDSQAMISAQSWLSWTLTALVRSFALGGFPARFRSRKATGPRSALDRYFVGRGQCKPSPPFESFTASIERRMDIGFAADRRRVAERLGDRLEHRLEADAVLAGGADRLEGDDARAPGAEMLGGEILAGRRADIVVDVGRADRMGLAVAVDILEEVLARQVLAAFDDPRRGARR